MKTMIIIPIALALTAGIGIPARAGEGEAPQPDAPTISFRETVYDAGDSWEGEVVSHTFTFTNTGNAELKISRVRSTCGCTASNLSSDTIAPGESGEIRASFNTQRYRGKKSQPIYVYSNDPANPTIQLLLETTVKTVAAFSPPDIQFGNVAYGKSEVRTAEIVFDAEPAPVLEVSAQPDFFSARIVEAAEGKGEAGEKRPVRIEVTISPEAPIGRQSGTLTARIDHPKMSNLTGRVFAAVEGTLQYSPRMVFFSQQDQKLGTVKTISLTNQAEEPVTIREVKSGIPQFEAALKTIRAGKEFAVEVRLRPEAEPGRLSGELTIETDVPGQEKILIPLRANLNP